MKNKILNTLLLVGLLFMGSISYIGASTWTTDITIASIPGGGESKDSTKYNTKTNDSVYATFRATYISAALGNSARLINSNGALRSEWVTLSTSKNTYAKESDCVKNYYYYPRVKSNAIEWGNSNTVKFKFSADKK